MYKEIFYDRQFRIWVGRIVALSDDQVGDCEYFPRKEFAQAWKAKPVTEILRNGTYTPAYYNREGGSMCNGIGRSYF